jgi:hypothetical protein
MDMPYEGTAGREGHVWTCSEKHVPLFFDFDCRRIKTKTGINYPMAFPRIPYANYSDAKYAHVMIATAEWPDKMKIKDSVVHHIVGNGENNALSNLLVLSRKEHVKLHKDQDKLNYTAAFLSSMTEKGVLSKTTLAALLYELEMQTSSHARGR